MASGNRTLMGSVGALNDVDTTARNPLGTIVPDETGNEYVYVKGVASVVAGDWGVFYGDYTTARSLNTPLGGRLGVYMAALVASTFGWMQISGVVSATDARGNGIVSANILTDAAADKKPLYLSATAGRLTTTAAASCAIAGAYGYGASASNVGAAFISRPVAWGYAAASV